MSRHKAKLKARRKRLKGRGPATVDCNGGYTCGCARCVDARSRSIETALHGQGLAPVHEWEGDLDAPDGLRARKMRQDGRGLVHGRVPS